MGNEKDRHRIEEYKKHPMTNLADSINRSMIGGPGDLTRGGCLSRLMTIIVLIGLLFLLYYLVT
jgi:hypothetical protein